MGVMMSVLTVLLTIKDWYPWLPYFNIALLFFVICIYGLGPTDLFLQMWRPSAFAVGGIVNWGGLFLIGMLFPYVVWNGTILFPGICCLLYLHCSIYAVFHPRNEREILNGHH
ncbi:solute carrier family 2, facilitated glucose transporter member 5-like isoform X2 [Alosa alosa]|uniref:solute carrier family 2, facilitated glucose transporter member 5-like isoform X2 n=1 Tax=Alosa alosa TaxID=278164 RepID=UPI0020152B02|nr:solute carrier family 2, facilitated glucose transporter member 5-like isoform X2 [Alosa alosa]